MLVMLQGDHGENYLNFSSSHLEYPIPDSHFDTNVTFPFYDATMHQIWKILAFPWLWMIVLQNSKGWLHFGC